MTRMLKALIVATSAATAVVLLPFTPAVMVACCCRINPNWPRWQQWIWELFDYCN